MEKRLFIPKPKNAIFIARLKLFHIRERFVSKFIGQIEPSDFSARIPPPFGTSATWIFKHFSHINFTFENHLSQNFLHTFQLGSEPLHYGFWRIFSKPFSLSRIILTNCIDKIHSPEFSAHVPDWFWASTLWILKSI